MPTENRSGGQIHKVRFFRTTALVPALIGARDQWTVPRLKGQLARLDLLVLDELGHVPASRVGAEPPFDVITTAYECTRLIVTGNLPFESWTGVLGSERLTGAILDRLAHRCNIIETKARAAGSKTPRPDSTSQATSRSLRQQTCGPSASRQVTSSWECCCFRPGRAADLGQHLHRRSHGA